MSLFAATETTSKKQFINLVVMKKRTGSGCNSRNYEWRILLKL
jgi:hypothetical protein